MRQFNPEKIAVVSASEISVHSGTSRNTVVQFKLHAGTEARWVEKREPWLRIHIDESKQGWVHTDEVISFRR